MSFAHGLLISSLVSCLLVFNEGNGQIYCVHWIHVVEFGKEDPSIGHLLIIKKEEQQNKLSRVIL